MLFLRHFWCLLHNRLQRRWVKMQTEGMLSWLETEGGNHGVLQQWNCEEKTVYVPFYLPLCAHSPHVKPSDACTAALTCQSQLGEGQQTITKPPHPPTHTLHGREGVKKTCKKVLDVTAAVAECENSLRGYDLERKLLEAGVCKAISKVELGCFRG